MKKKIKQSYKVRYGEYRGGGVGLFFKKNDKTLKGITDTLKNFGYAITDLLTERYKGVEYYRVYSKKQFHLSNYKYEIIFVLAFIILYIIKRFYNFSFF